MRNDLDHSKAEEARKLIEEGDKEVSVNCMTCQGHSMPGGQEEEPGYCPSCGGTCYVQMPLWQHWQREKKIDYWQARAMIAEMALESALKHLNK